MRLDFSLVIEYLGFLLMQCAAVRTYRLFIKLPPHLNSPPAYSKRAKNGNSPCFAILPDKRLFVFVGFPHSFIPPSGIQDPLFLGFLIGKF